MAATTTALTTPPAKANQASAVHKSVHNYKLKGRFSVREPALTLVAGVGFEPTTSGL
jgi:hypothetical protein